MAPRRKKHAPLIASNSLVASSAHYAGSVARIYRPSQGWQKECYRHFEICGEARAAARFYGHAMGKATLHIAEKGDDGWVKVKDGAEVEDLEALFNGKDGQVQMLESIGVHLTIAGECYLVGREVAVEETSYTGETIEPGEVWEIVSVLEMVVSGKKWSIKYADNMAPVDLTENDTVIRIWLSHPAKRIEADSPFRSMLPILNEIEKFTEHIFAQTISRLAGAGLLFVPSEIDFPPPPPVDGEEQVLSGNKAVEFMKTLGPAMIKPIENRSHPASLIPIVVMCPGESIDKVKHLKMWSELDAKALEMRSAAIHRFGVSMDLPVEQVEGMSSNGGTGGGNSNGVSHWGAWQIEESTIKMFVEPGLELVVNALTISYIRKLQIGSKRAVRFDTAALKLRPDRSQEALTLYQMGLLSITKVLEENGFSDADKPKEDEFKEFLLFKLATGSATPEMVNAALKLLKVDLGIQMVPDDAASLGMPQLPAPPSLGELPERPRTPDPAESEALAASAAASSRAQLLAACEGLVISGLGRAGNRLRSGKGAETVGDCRAYEVHTQVAINGKADYALTDAFAGADIILDGIADPEQVTAVLTSYCKSLFASQEPHTREKLAKYLEVGVPA